MLHYGWFSQIQSHMRLSINKIVGYGVSNKVYHKSPQRRQVILHLPLILYIQCLTMQNYGVVFTCAVAICCISHYSLMLC